MPSYVRLEMAGWGTEPLEPVGPRANRELADMAVTSRVRVLGLLAVGLAWGCGQTVPHGDSDSNETASTGSSAGFGGDSTGGSGGSDTSDGGASTTRGNDSGTAATTDGNTTSGQSNASTSATSSNSGAVSNGAGGMVGTSDSVSTTVSTAGDGGSGGDPSTHLDLDDFPYLDDCVDTYWGVGNESCVLGFSCSENSGNSNCYDIGNGEFACDCSLDDYHADYWLAGAGVADACAYAASACVAGPAAERGQPVCTPSSVYQGATFCDANATCRTTLEIEGVDMAKTGDTYVACEERGPWYCDCDPSQSIVSLTLRPEDGSVDMCVEALDWCAGEFTREGPRSCESTDQIAYADSCYADLRCTQDVVVDGVPAELSESLPLNCQRDGSSTFVCYCPGTVEIETEDAWEACELAASECKPD